MLRNYYIQILTLVAMLNNTIASIWSGDKSYHVALSGNYGWQKYYHYWLLFDYRSQLFLYLIGMLMVLRFPLEGANKTYAKASLIAYICLYIIEVVFYLWDGNDARIEGFSFFFLFLYVVVLGVLAFFAKVWK